MMMNATDFMKFQAEAVKASNALAAKSIEGIQKLADLNMKTAKAGMEQSAEQVKALMGAKDVKAMTETLSGLSQPNADHVTAYVKDAYAITSETSQEVVSMVEGQVDEGNKQLFAAIDAMAKNAPAGSETAISFMKQSLTAARAAYEQANKAGKQAAELVENTMAPATKAPAKKR
ncbi:MAG: phasin family protein [Burkholderiaceae bacterium]